MRQGTADGNVRHWNVEHLFVEEWDTARTSAEHLFSAFLTTDPRNAPGREGAASFRLPQELLREARALRDHPLPEHERMSERVWGWLRGLVSPGRRAPNKAARIGRAVWRALPRGIKDQLNGYTEKEHLCVVVHAAGEAQVLPWEAIGEGFYRPFEQGHGHLLRAGPTWSEESPSLAHRPSVLLLVGSVDQVPGVRTAKHDVLGVAHAIIEAGLDLTVCSGIKQIEGFDRHKTLECHLLRDPEKDLQTYLRNGFDIFHFIGHSDAEVGQNRDATALLLEVSGSSEPVPLEIADLAASLEASKACLAVLQACKITDGAAHSILSGNGGPSTLLGLAAMTPPRLCPGWAAEFYRCLDQRHSVAAASWRAARKLHPHDWIPVIWSCHSARDPLWDETAAWASQFKRSVLDACKELSGSYDFLGASENLGDLRRVYVDIPARTRGQVALRQQVTVRAEVGTEGEETTDGRESSGRELRSPEPRTMEALLSERGSGGTEGGLAPRWILTGGAGSGKTTLVRRLAIALADPEERRLGGELRRRGVIPVPVVLTEWMHEEKPGRLLRHAVHSYLGWDPGADPYEAMLKALESRGRDGKLVFFLDGLDELAPEKRVRLPDLLRRELTDFSSCSWLVTSRSFGASLWVGEGFDRATVEELRPDQAGQIYANVLRELGWNDDDSAKASDLLIKDLKDPQKPRFLHEFSKSPLFTTLLALLRHDGNTLAGKRIDALNDFFRALTLRTYKSERDLTWLDPQDKVESGSDWAPRVDACLDILGVLALRMTQRRHLTCSGEKLIQDLTELLQPSERADSEAPARSGIEEALSKRLGEAFCRLDRSDAGSNRAARFLIDVSRHTLVLLPRVAKVRRESTIHDETEETQSAEYGFWHRSFQETLASRVLATEGLGKEASELMACLGRTEPSAKDVAGVRELLLRKWESGVQLLEDFITARDTVLNSEEWTSLQPHFASTPQFREQLAEAVAPVQARREKQEYVLEVLGSLASSMQPYEAGSLLRELFKHDYYLGTRTVGRVDVLDKDTVDWLLPQLRAIEELRTTVSALVHQLGATELLSSLHEYGTSLRQTDDSGHDPRGRLEVLCAYLSRGPKPFGLAEKEAPCMTAYVESLRCEGRTIYVWQEISPSEFPMGSPEGELGRFGDERLHTRRIERPYWIAAVSVTIAMFEPFDPSHITWCNGEWRRIRDIKMSEDGTVPVTGVSWYKARHWCRWATEVILPVLLEEYPGLREPFAADAQLELRLPTEPEWEYAARAGTTGAFWFEDSFKEGAEVLEEYGWFGEGEEGSPHPVATKTGGANPWGLFDVHGNVWEWCSDRYGPYPEGPGPHSDRGGPPTGALRVLRGGSYGDEARFCRSANRSWDAPADLSRDVGFRVVLAAVSSEGS